MEEYERFFSPRSISKLKIFPYREERIATKRGNHEEEWQAGTCQFFFLRVETRGVKDGLWVMRRLLRDDFPESRAVSLGVIARDSDSGSRARTRRVRRADRDDPLYRDIGRVWGGFPVRAQCVAAARASPDSAGVAHAHTPGSMCHIP